LGEGWGEGKNLAMQEVIVKSLFPTAVFRLNGKNGLLSLMLFLHRYIDEGCSTWQIVDFA